MIDFLVTYELYTNTPLLRISQQNFEKIYVKTKTSFTILNLHKVPYSLRKQ